VTGLKKNGHISDEIGKQVVLK